MSESLLIRFRTDDSIVFEGFSAAYVSIDPDPDPIDSEEMAVSRAVTGAASKPHLYSKWSKPRSPSRLHYPLIQKHLKHTDFYSNQKRKTTFIK